MPRNHSHNKGSPHRQFELCSLATCIVYEDNHLCVANKPAGLLTQEDGTHRANLQTLLAAFLGKRDSKPSAAYLHAVHRIDKPVSGLVLFAKTSKALARLHAAFREHQIKKEYLAHVEGIVQADQATLVQHLSHQSHHAIISPTGAESELSYQTIARGRHSSLLLVVLKTGRYHQIRVQLGACGHPIIGDRSYGSTIALNSDEVIALHSYRLTLLHPVKLTSLTFEAAPPDWTVD